LVKISRLEIPKNEEDLKKITEKIMKEEPEENNQNEEVAEEVHQEHVDEHEVGLDIIAHEVAHLYELMHHLVQTVREVRDSIDDLVDIVKENTKILALLQLINVVNDEELKQRLLEQVMDYLGIKLEKARDTQRLTISSTH
jgi:hypothetical protein